MAVFPAFCPRVKAWLALDGLSLTRLQAVAQMRHADVAHAGAQGLKEKKLAQENMDKVDKLKPIAEKLGVPLAQLALAWWAPCAFLQL